MTLFGISTADKPKRSKSSCSPRTGNNCRATCRFHSPADFWEMVRALLSSLDLEIQDMVRKGSIDMRLQNLQKGKPTFAELPLNLHKRMVAMMQHAASQALRSGEPRHGQDSSLTGSATMCEKAFYHALQLNVDRFKKEIDWQGMQQGLLGEIMMQPPTRSVPCSRTPLLARAP